MRKLFLLYLLMFSLLVTSCYSPHRSTETERESSSVSSQQGHKSNHVDNAEATKAKELPNGHLSNSKFVGDSGKRLDPRLQSSNSVPSKNAKGVAIKNPSTPKKNTSSKITDRQQPVISDPTLMYVSTSNGAGLNLREAPGVSSGVLMVIPNGSRIRVWKKDSQVLDGYTWYRASYGSASGYVASTFLSSDLGDSSVDKDQNTIGKTIISKVDNGSNDGRAYDLKGNTWTLNAVGDIMLSRSVLYKMRYYGSYRHPYLRTAKLLRDADFTIANLELPLSDRIPPPADDHTMTFVAPTAVADGLKWAGIDAVTLANNHTLNFGQAPLVDTLKALDKYGIGHFGGGVNWEQAYSPAIYNIKGVKVAFLGFDGVYWWNWSNKNAPGIATAWEDPVREAIARARQQADVVIPYFHWGVEYTSVPNQFQRHMARVAIDAGADLVLGSHPHWVQQVEVYKGKLIVYSMGNFVFDQMWSQETRQGVIVKFTFQGKNLVSAKFLPVLIEDYNQPVPATGYDYRAVLDRMGVEPIVYFAKERVPAR